MPIPRPRKNEKEGDFISRCMSNKTMQNEFPDKDKLRILCVSRLIERKGIDYLLRSIPLIKEKIGDMFERFTLFKHP